MNSPFSIEESLKFGWAKTKEHSGLIFKALLTIFALEIASAIVSKVLENTLIGFLGNLAIGIAGFVVGVGLTFISLRIAQGKHVEFKDIIPPLEVLWRYFLASLLVCLAVFAGFILLIIPGIYLALRFSLYRFAILDGAGVTDSIKKSSELTKGVKWQLLGFFIVMGVINILGAIALLIGLLITIPVTMIAYAHIYQKLSSRTS
jgi:hypothetical protein